MIEGSDRWPIIGFNPFDWLLFVYCGPTRLGSSTHIPERPAGHNYICCRADPSLFCLAFAIPSVVPIVFFLFFNASVSHILDTSTAHHRETCNWVLFFCAQYFDYNPERKAILKLSALPTSWRTDSVLMPLLCVTVTRGPWTWSSTGIYCLLPTVVYSVQRKYSCPHRHASLPVKSVPWKSGFRLRNRRAWMSIDLLDPFFIFPPIFPRRTDETRTYDVVWSISRNSRGQRKE